MVKQDRVDFRICGSGYAAQAWLEPPASRAQTFSNLMPLLCVLPPHVTSQAKVAAPAPVFQHKGRKKERQKTKFLSTVYTPHLLTPTGQNSVTRPYLAIKGAEKYLYSAQPGAQLKTGISMTIEKDAGMCGEWRWTLSTCCLCYTTTPSQD